MVDKIFSIEAASEFTKMTKDKKRKNMSNEICKTWFRRFLKQVIKSELYISVSANFSLADMSVQNLERMGHIVDEVLKLTESDRQGPMGNKIDEIFKKYWPALLRLRSS